MNEVVENGGASSDSSVVEENHKGMIPTQVSFSDESTSSNNGINKDFSVDKSPIPQKRDNFAKMFSGRVRKDDHQKGGGSSVSTTKFSEKLSTGSNTSVPCSVVFYNKRNRRSSLNLPSTLYKKLIAGEEVSFFQQAQLSLMTVRVSMQEKFSRGSHEALEQVSENFGSASTGSILTGSVHPHDKGCSMLEDANTEVDMEDVASNNSVSDITYVCPSKELEMPLRHEDSHLCDRHGLPIMPPQNPIFVFSSQTKSKKPIFATKSSSCFMRRSGRTRNSSNKFSFCRSTSGMKRRGIMESTSTQFQPKKKKIALSKSSSSKSLFVDNLDVLCSRASSSSSASSSSITSV